jgi:hypothetical protein
MNRTTDPILLKQKATDYLNRHYNKNKSIYNKKFYMLEPTSINGIKQVSCHTPTYMHNELLGCKVTEKYTDLNGQKQTHENELYNDTDSWSRTLSAKFGAAESASTVKLGGKRKVITARVNKKKKNRKTKKRT